MKELWKTVKNYRGLYMVSNLGRVKSIIKVNGKRKNLILSQRTSGTTKYPKVNLYKDGEVKTVCVHRLVATAFLRNQSKKAKEVDHIDGNKKNNKASNLRWVTHSQNMEFHRVRKNLRGAS